MYSIQGHNAQGERCAVAHTRRPIVRQSYGCPDPADYASPGEYSRAARGWEHAQAVCGCLRPVKPLPLDDQLPNA